MSILNTEINVNKLTLKNRIVLPPMATSKAGDDGEVTLQVCDYYAEKSEGGYLGLIISEHCYISQDGKAEKNQISIARDEDVEGLKKITQLVHSNGCPIFAQISHAGGAAKKEFTGHKALRVSTVKPGHEIELDDETKEMTKDDIKQVVADFASAAARAKEAGFDGVEIHSAHGYLLNQFYSPVTNQRSDEYGPQNLNSRIRIHLEVIEAIRAAVGADFPVALRLGVWDYTKGGINIEDAAEASVCFEQAGVDMIDISSGLHEKEHPTRKEEGYFSEVTEAVKEKVSVPVVLSGGIREAKTAERFLEEGKADLIGVGHAILNDSAWAKNALASV
ncbi:MAG: NADH:flavin oxidoreductase [Lachnospiraceae bacterium]|nr:NADH:flavin oxidoreductase [Lachnospiraceae bacterium]